MVSPGRDLPDEINSHSSNCRLEARRQRGRYRQLYFKGDPDAYLCIDV